MKKTFWEQIQEKQEKYIQENLNEIAEEIKRKIFDDIEKEGEKMKMSKYKNGDKFIVEIEKVYRDWVKSIDEKEDFFKIKNLSAISLRECDFDKFDKFDETKTYEQGLADAWEAARKIILSYKDYSTLKPTDFQAVFGTVDISEVFEKFTAAEAIAKIKEHEEKQIINVGDEVYFISECKGVLICKDDSSYTILWDDESVIVYDKQKHRAIELKKTGRHFPQVEEMLKAMKE